MSKADLNESVHTNARQLVADDITVAKKRIEQLEEALAALEDKTNYRRTLKFRIRLESMWANEGEKNHEITGSGLLATLIERAEREFMAKNNGRGDVQAYYHIWLLVLIEDTGIEIPIPENIWKSYKLRERTKK